MQAELFESLLKALSTSRLAPYCHDGSGGSDLTPFSRYLWNTALSESLYPTFPIWLKSFLSNSSMVFQPLSHYGPFLRVPSYNNSMICHFAVKMP